MEMNGLAAEYLELLKMALMDLLGPNLLTAKRKLDGSVEIVPGSRERRLDGHDWPANAVTMIGHARLTNLQQCIETVLTEDVPGDVIECGVWRGGASIFARALLRLHSSDRCVVLADSFRGLPEPEHEHDLGGGLHKFDHLAVSVDEVRQNFERFRLLDDQVRFIEGFFADTLPELKGQWSVIRLDGDMYDSTMVALESLYPSLSPGGFLIIDDYKLPPCRKAVHDYRDANGIEEPMEQIDWTGVFWRKP
jgi:O-methyltransferase